MNVDQAKTIPISDVAERLGAKLHKRIKPHITVWFSPFRNEKTASFHIDERTNSFKDWGHHLPKGDVIDLWVDFHGLKRNDPESTKQALKALEAFDTIPRTTIYKEAKAMTYSDHYQIKKLSDRVTAANLKEEIDRRRLPKGLVERYVKQSSIYDNETKKTFYAFAFENDKEGHEINIYNPRLHKSFKTCIGPKAISTFPAHPEATDVTAFVFTGFFDFLTWLNLKGLPKPNEEYIVSNGDSMISSVGEYLTSKNVQIARVLSFTDHDVSGSGERTMHALASILEAEGVHFGSMDHLYDGHKDLSAAHIGNTSGLQSAYRANSPRQTLRPR
ncbi:hypothetical protein [Dyadobacter jiangsuensis]|uniref:Toprim domain-containing protein n=1 Tax=Dyadobacter jiangsuensis TaxID=1591085 RepID=A0A2P8FP68_9BACT|nr:hypothetical protein [Dyadobacter jiangsuensis]PSL23497.1 hypothetical protein CLV60_11652 [Dyadobacter jiangsuensis]